MITTLLVPTVLQGLLSLPGSDLRRTGQDWYVSRRGRTGTSHGGASKDSETLQLLHLPLLLFLLTLLFCFCFCFCFRFCQFTFFFFYFFFFLIILSFILFLLSFFSYLSYIPWRPFCPWWTKYANSIVFRSTIGIAGVFTIRTDHRQRTDILSV